VSERSDALRNRAAVLAAARTLFAQRGPDVALGAIADAAGVSRTTLYRNFATREDLAATVLQDNVALIEQRAAELTGQPEAALHLLRFVFDLQLSNRSVARVLGSDDARLVALGERTSAAFHPLVERARRRGQLHAGVTTHDFLLALQMAQVGLADGRSFDRVTGILLRGLFRSL